MERRSKGRCFVFLCHQSRSDTTNEESNEACSTKSELPDGWDDPGDLSLPSRVPELVQEE